MALKYYDIEIDQSREPTQADIDVMTATVQAYGKLRALVAQNHAELLVEIDRTKARGKPLVDTPEALDATQDPG